MRHVGAVVLVALVASLVLVPMVSAQAKWVRGTVVAVTADSLTVKAAGKDMTFKVDKNTDVTAPGAGTAQREAEKKGAAGVTLVEWVKPGGGVEVQYKEAGGVMTATEIRAGIAVGEGAAGQETSGGSVHGAITAITANSLTVKGGDKEWTFTVDPKTLVVGTGMGTITKQFQEKGKAPAITDLLGPKDTVTVYFKEAAGVMRASEVRVTARAAR